MKGELDWIKVNVNSFDDNKIRIISSMPQGDSIICIWFRLLFEAGKNNDEGYVYLNEAIPYTCEMLAKIFDRSIKKVKYALDVLKDFMMIEIDDDHFIKIKNWNKYQSVDKLEAIRESGKERTRRCRAKKKAEMEAAKLIEEMNNKESNKESTLINEEANYKKYSYNNEENLEVAADYETNNYNIKTNDYSQELNSCSDECNVTSNATNVTVTDKIKTKDIDKEREEERDIDKKQDKNNNLNLSSNVTSNAKNCYTDMTNEMLQQRYTVTNANSINGQDSNELKQAKCDNIDIIIKEILITNHNNSKCNIEIANVIYNFYKDRGTNKNWIEVDKIRWMLLEHDWIYVKTAIEIAIAASAFDCIYVERLLGTWKEQGYPKVG